MGGSGKSRKRHHECNRYGHTALHHCDATGRGQYIDVALFDAQLAWLANVDEQALLPLLRACWGREGLAVAVSRLVAYRDTHALHAAQVRRETPRKQHDVPALVDELTRTKKAANKKAAFAQVAELRHVDNDTIRNAYYAQRNREDVNP